MPRARSDETLILNLRGQKVLRDADLAANVLNSPDAVRMSVHAVRAFIKQRELIAGQAEILKKLAQIDATLLKHDEASRIIWQELQPLLAPPPEPEKPEIGFHVREPGAKFKANPRGKSMP